MLGGFSASFNKSKLDNEQKEFEMMSEMETIPVERYLVCERGNIREAEDFHNFERADDFLQKKRDQEPEKNWVMYAEVDA